MTPDAPPRTRYCSRCLTTFGGTPDRCPNLGCRTTRPANSWGELLESGELLDRTYRIHSRLAIGGAGVTYLGREVSGDDVEMGPLLALKVLYQQRDQGPYLRRLATEAQILQGMNHPNIVECRGFVHRSGHSPYLVTKFENGGSLLDHIRRVGVLNARTTAAVGVQICDALAVAHRQGVIHRDLKPENVLLEEVVSRDELPKMRVADFGIAKVFGGVGERLTRVGAFIGTPQYAAPEQFEGIAPEPATDVYAVGALLYFCMTTRPVAEHMAELDFEDQREQLLRALPVRLTGIDGTEGAWMENVLAAAMTPDPGDRCSIETFAERLHHIAKGRDPGFIARLPAANPLGPPPLPGIDLGASKSDTISAHPKGQAKSPGWASPVANTDNSLDTSILDELPVSLPATGSAPPLPPLPPPPSAGAPSAKPTDGLEPIPSGNIASIHSQIPHPVIPAAAPSELDAPDVIRATTIGDAFGPGAVPGQALNPVPTLERLPRTSSTGGGAAAKTGIGCVAGGTLLGIAGIIAAGAVWWFTEGNIVRLTGKESDPRVAAEWRAIAGAIGVAGVKAERTCKTPPYIAMEATIRPDGTVASVRLLNYDSATAEACIAREFGKLRVPRVTTGTVRVAVTMGS